MSEQILWSRHSAGLQLRGGLQVVEQVYARLGRPIGERPAVHIVGTNGKGSSAMLLEHALRRRGWRTGLYISPHLHRLGERIQLSGVSVEDAVVHAQVERIAAVEASAPGPRPLSFFELLTLAAFTIFEQAEVDVAIVEAGLGGGRDATRVMRASAVAITSIGLDHAAVIGPTQRDIATEKAGAMAPNVPVFSVPQDEAVARVLVEVAESLECPLRWVEPWPAPPAGLRGRHQGANAALAVAVGQQLDPGLTPEDLAGASIPGRLEVRPQGRGALWLDVAHNPEGIAAMASAVVEAEPRRLTHVVLGCHIDKDPTAMVRALGPLLCPVWWVPLDDDGDSRPDAPVTRVFAGLGDPTLWPALEAGLAQGHTVLVCGSHRLVGAVRAWSLGLETPTALQDPRPKAVPRASGAPS